MNIKNRLRSIDFLRGFAIIGIIICHIGENDITNTYFRIMVQNCSHFVQLFFIITTFLCIESLDETEIFKKKVRIYWLKRHLLRIAPIYYVFFIIYAMIAYWGGGILKIIQLAILAI